LTRQGGAAQLRALHVVSIETIEQRIENGVTQGGVIAAVTLELNKKCKNYVISILLRLPRGSWSTSLYGIKLYDLRMEVDNVSLCN
jgi:hypothetical protein